MSILEPDSESGNHFGPGAGNGESPVSQRVATAAKARKNLEEQFNNLLHHLTHDLFSEFIIENPQSSGAGVEMTSVG